MKRHHTYRMLTFLTLAASLLLVSTLSTPAFAQADHAEHTPPHATMGTVHLADDHAEGKPATEAEHGAHATEHGAAGAGAGEHGEHAEGEEHTLGTINWTDFGNKKQPPVAVFLINLLILVALMVKFGGPSVMTGLKVRRDRVAKEIEDAQRMKKEADQRAKRYQAMLEGLDDELDATKKALIDGGVADKERLVKEAQEKAARMERDAKSLLEQEARQVQQDLVRETVELALAAAEDLLRKRVTQADQERLAEDFLASFATRGRATPSIAPSARPAGPGGES